MGRSFLMVVICIFVCIGEAQSQRMKGNPDNERVNEGVSGSGGEQTYIQPASSSGCAIKFNTCGIPGMEPGTSYQDYLSVLDSIESDATSKMILGEVGPSDPNSVSQRRNFGLRPQLIDVGIWAKETTQTVIDKSCAAYFQNGSLALDGGREDTGGSRYDRFKAFQCEGGVALFIEDRNSLSIDGEFVGFLDLFEESSDISWSSFFSSESFLRQRRKVASYDRALPICQRNSDLNVCAGLEYEDYYTVQSGREGVLWWGDIDRSEGVISGGGSFISSAWVEIDDEDDEDGVDKESVYRENISRSLTFPFASNLELKVERMSAEHEVVDSNSRSREDRVFDSLHKYRDAAITNLSTDYFHRIIPRPFSLSRLGTIIVEECSASFPNNSYHVEVSIGEGMFRPTEYESYTPEAFYSCARDKIRAYEVEVVPAIDLYPSGEDSSCLVWSGEDGDLGVCTPEIPDNH